MTGNGHILCANDPAPFEIINGGSEYPVVPVCEHAGQAVPNKLNNLGVSGAHLDSHVPWDIGALSLVKGIPFQLQVPLALQPYSISDSTDWFVPAHREKRGLPHSLIEVRNDHLRSSAICRRWSELLANNIPVALQGA